jgi:hypothetical protein
MVHLLRRSVSLKRSRPLVSTMPRDPMSAHALFVSRRKEPMAQYHAKKHTQHPGDQRTDQHGHLAFFRRGRTAGSRGPRVWLTTPHGRCSLELMRTSASVPMQLPRWSVWPREGDGWKNPRSPEAIAGCRVTL